jgi:hypothetical protein
MKKKNKEMSLDGILEKIASIGTELKKLHPIPFNQFVPGTTPPLTRLREVWKSIRSGEDALTLLKDFQSERTLSQSSAKLSNDLFYLIKAIEGKLDPYGDPFTVSDDGRLIVNRVAERAQWKRNDFGDGNPKDKR